MSISGERLARAQDRQAAARARLKATIDEIKDRLSPATLARKAGEQIVGASEDMAEAGIGAARRHSRRIAGMGAALALLLLRRRIGRWLRRQDRREKRDETVAEPASLDVKRAKAHRRRRSR
jgi:hypothetical protein